MCTIYIWEILWNEKLFFISNVHSSNVFAHGAVFVINVVCYEISFLDNSWEIDFQRNNKKKILALCFISDLVENCRPEKP